MKTHFNTVRAMGYRVMRLCVLLAASLGAVFSCSQKSQGGDTQTNWLKACSTDRECGTLSCECGHCVQPCTSNAECANTALPTTCQPATADAVQSLCGGVTDSSAMCLGTCTDSAPCAGTERCVAGSCLPALPAMTPPDSGVPDSAGTPTAGTVSGEFCPRFFEALCKHMESCGCDAAAAARCRAFATQTCSDPTAPKHAIWAGYDQAVSDGALLYHPERIAAALAPLADPGATCQNIFTDLGFDIGAASTFAGVLTGTRPLGQPCQLPVSFKGGAHDCQDGLICRGLSAQTTRCVALVGEGEACDTSADPGRVCFLRRAPDSDNEFATAFDLLRCVPDAAGSATGLCAQNLVNGLPCTLGESCQSGRCAADAVAGTSRCAPRLVDGQACTRRTDCVSGGCPSVDGAECAGPLANGQPCGYDDQDCQSGSCQAPDNQTSRQSPGLCGPKLDRAIGQACAQGYECASGLCRSDRCWAPICNAF